MAPTDAGELIVTASNDVTVADVDVSDCSMGLIVAYCSDVSVQRVTADRCGIFGTYFAYVDGAEMVDTSAADTNHALDFRACKNLLLKDCRAIDCDQGIFFSYVDDSRIQNCEATGTGQGFFFAAGNHNTVSQCRADHCENGMNVQKENDMLILNSTFTATRSAPCALTCHPPLWWITPFQTTGWTSWRTVTPR